MDTRAVARRRHRPVAIVAATVAVAGAAALAWTGPIRAESHDIAIVDFEFQPATLTVFVGEPVTWTNNSSRDHTVTSDQGTELDGNPILPGEAYGHVFETPGTYAYHCEFHDDQMTGTIVVQPAPVTPQPSGSPEPTPPAGTLPPNFSPFPPGPTETSPPPTVAATPSQDGSSTDGSQPLVILVVVAAILAVGAGAALLLRRRSQG